MVLIPDIASPRVGCSLTVVLLTTDKKYNALVSKPTTGDSSKVLYITCSAFLNLWNVENPIVSFVKETLSDTSSAKNFGAWLINFILTEPNAPWPFPPSTFRVGVCK